jgi:hypothetical protein
MLEQPDREKPYHPVSGEIQPQGLKPELVPICPPNLSPEIKNSEK